MGLYVHVCMYVCMYVRTIRIRAYTYWPLVVNVSRKGMITHAGTGLEECARVGHTQLISVSGWVSCQSNHYALPRY